MIGIAIPKNNTIYTTGHLKLSNALETTVIIPGPIQLEPLSVMAYNENISPSLPSGTKFDVKLRPNPYNDAALNANENTIIHISLLLTNPNEIPGINPNKTYVNI